MMNSFTHPFLRRLWVNEYGHALKAIAMLWAATLASAGLVFLTQILLARSMGPPAYGLFASSLATVNMLAPFAGFGTSSFWLRAYGAEGWTADRWLKPSWRLIGRTTSLAVLMLIGWTCLGSSRDGTPITILLLLPVVGGALAVDLVGSKLRLEERHGNLSAWNLLVPVSRISVSVLCIALQWTAAEQIALAYGAASLVVVCLAAPHLTSMAGGQIRLMGHGDRPPTTRSLPVPSVCELWTRSWPYGLSTVLYPIYFQASTVLVKHLSTNEAAGMFGLGATVLTAVYLLPTTIYQKFLLSKLHRWATYDQRRFWSVYRQGILAMLLAGAAIGALLAATGPTAVAIAFGVQYSPVGRIVQCLAICVPLRFVTTAIGSALLNEAQMRFRVLAMASSAIVVVLVNLVAVPNLVEFGAVIAMIAGEATLLIMMTLGVRHSRVRPNAA